MLDRSQFAFLGPALEASALQINRCAFKEPMPSNSIVDRPEGTEDIFFLWMHDDCIIDRHYYPANTLMCWSNNSGHHYGDQKGSENTVWIHSWLHAQGIIAERLLSALDYPFQLSTSDEEQVARLMRQFIQSCVLDREPVLARLYCEAFVHGLEKLGRRNDDHEKRMVPQKWQNLRMSIDQNLHEHVSLDELAQKMDLAKSQFSKLWGEYFGISPLRYIMDQRMERARWLLRDRNRSVASIAQELGFEDPAYFSRMVKKHLGFSPRMLRQLR